MSPVDFRKLMQECRDFGTLHAGELAEELIEWQDTSILRNGKLRALRGLCLSIADNHALSVAKSIAERAIIEQFVALKRAEIAAKTVDKKHNGPCWRNSHADCGC